VLRSIAMTNTLTFGDDWPGFAELDALPWYGFEMSDRPHGIRVCFGEAEDGRLVCIGLLIDPRKNVEVSTRLLREIPLGAIVHRASTGPPVERPPGSARYRIRKPRPGPKGLPLKHYERVADAYKLAVRTHPRTPVRRLMAQMGGISESSAHRYLEKCRELGLLDLRITKGKQS
jgi:hypothetical protein